MKKPLLLINKSKSFILILLCILPVVLAQSLMAQNIVKSAFIQYKGTTPYFFYYQDDFLDDYEAFFDIRDKTKKIRSIAINIDQPLLIRFSGNDDQIPVLILPGDTLTIEPLQARIIGRRPQELNFYTFLEKQQVGMGIPDFWSIEWTAKLKFEALLDEFKRVRDRRLAIADSLKALAQVSDNFYQLATYEIQSAYIQALLVPFVKPHQNGFNVNNLPTWYLDTLAHYKSFFKRDDLLGRSSLTYRACLNNYVRYLTFVTGNADTYEGQYQTARDLLTGKNRDYALFSAVKLYLKETSAALAKTSILNQYGHDIKSKPYIDNLNKTIQSKTAERNELLSARSFRETALETPTGKTITWGNFLSTNQTSVIYTDMWASWCAPCRKEMPGSIALSNQLKDRNIRYVYISIDDNRSKWLSSMKALKFSTHSAQHYRLNPTSTLAKLLTKGAIPKYIIIDKGGSVYTMDGSRPSEEKTKSLLISLTQ